MIRPADGGMRNHLRVLLRGMAARGIRTLTAAPAPLAEALREEGFAVQTVDIDAGWRADRHLSAAWRVLHLARRHGVAVVHAHGGAAAFSAAPAARLAGVPALIVTAHGSPLLGGPWRRRAAVAAQRWPYRMADRVIAVSNALRTELAALGMVRPERAVTVHNGIAAGAYAAEGDQRERAEIRAALGLPPDHPVVGTVARLAPQKGVEYLVRAAARLGGAPAAPALLIAGDGPCRAALEREARELGVDAAFPGYVDDVRGVFRALDVFVLPSVTEGFALVLLEAMAAGLPVVAARVGGVPEVVRDGETGWLVPPGDPDALAAAVGRALADPARAAAFGAAGRARVRRLFTEERMVARTLRVYRETLLGAGRAELGIVF